MCANWLCAGRIGLGWAHDVFYIACHMFMHFPCIHTLFSMYLLYLNYLWLFWLSPSLLSFSVYVSLCLWHRNVNLLHLGTLFISRHHLLLILPPILFGYVMRMPERTSQRIFLDEVFIWNAESFWQTLPTLTYLMSFTVGVRSQCVTSQSHVLPCWSRSFTPTCIDLILQYLSFILVYEVCTLLSHQSWYSMCSVFRG